MFSDLGDHFSTPVRPDPLNAPLLLDLNERCTQLLPSLAYFTLSDWFALINGTRHINENLPRASVYSGHQFGVWAGQLGDGRAHLLGEVDGWELQLKGSGLTPYSRMGDGKAVLRSSIREHLASEYLAALGIPSTRSLGIISSQDKVRRESFETAAMIVRQSPSFIRFGHFEHFAAREDTANLQVLLEYTMTRYYPECRDPFDFFQAVSRKSAELCALWMAQGFCHGVLNTDNMSILGLTLDYGPYGFLEDYTPGHICNHSDHRGRYAYDQQPGVVQWNLMALAYALKQFFPVARAQGFIEKDYVEIFQTQYWQKICARFALPFDRAASSVIGEILDHMAKRQLPFHETIAAVANAEWPEVLGDELKAKYLALHTPELQAEARGHNPTLVLKNWVAQEVIAETEKGNYLFLPQVRAALQHPFAKDYGELTYLTGPTPPQAKNITVSCSS